MVLGPGSQNSGNSPPPDTILVWIYMSPKIDPRFLKCDAYGSKNTWVRRVFPKPFGIIFKGSGNRLMGHINSYAHIYREWIIPGSSPNHKAKPKSWPMIVDQLNAHSQKQSAHRAVDVTAKAVPCWSSSWLKRNFWPVLRPLTRVYFQFTGRDITWVSCFKTVDSGDIKSREWKMTWVSYIWTPESSLNLISPPNWISTERWLRWWYTVEWAIFSESTVYYYLFRFN